MSVPQLRPLGVGEMLDVALKIFWRNALTMFRLVVLILAPVTFLTVLLTYSATPDEDDLLVVDERTGEPTFAPEGKETLAAMIAGYGLAVVLGVIASTLATAACFKAVADAYLGGRPSWRSSLAYVGRRVHSVLWITFVASVLTVIGFVFCILPGIYLWVAFGVAIPVLLTESRRGTAALGRSRELVQGNWWRAFGTLLVGAVLTGVVGGALSGGVSAIAAVEDPTGDSPAAFTATFLADLFAGTLTVPFTAALVTVLYVDLRVRREAFDLQLLAEQIGVEPRPEHAAAMQLPAPPGPRRGDGDGNGGEPPYWPPPPGWSPGGGSRDDT